MVDMIKTIQDIEQSIEDVLWKSLKDDDHETALGEYELARQRLEALQDLPEGAEKERKRVLSYCLMRINDELEHLEQSEGSIQRAAESLKLAEESGSRVQTLRSRLALGVALLNTGKNSAAESHFTDIILQTQDESEDRDVIQVYGWTLIVRVNILLGKSLYDQAKELASHAIGVLSGIENYAGLRTAYSLLSRIYQIEGDTVMADQSREQAARYAELARERRQ